MELIYQGCLRNKCSFFDKHFFLKNRKRTRTDNINGDDDKMQNREEEMAKFEMETRKHLRSTVLRTLNAGHDQLAEQLNKGYAKLQAKK